MTDFSTALLVVAAALVDRNLQIFMHKRRFDAVHGGLWEFPGGKVEAGETPENALVRELAEELGVEVASADFEAVAFASGITQDGTRPLVILLYMCRRWSGEPRCLDGEEMGWFTVDALSGLAMPPLDFPLADALQRRLQNNCV